MASISQRGTKIKNSVDELLDAFSRQQQDKFDLQTNPEGTINLGTSENKLVFDILSQKFGESSSQAIQEQYTHYCPFNGIRSFRETIAAFLTHYCKPAKPIDPDDVQIPYIIMACGQLLNNNYMLTKMESSDKNCGKLFAFNGSGSIVEALGQMLAESGDGFLIPAPFYGGFKTDLQMRFDVIAYPVPLSPEPAPGETVPFELTVERLEKAFCDAKQKGIKIRALLLCNPNNPFGYIYSDQLVKDCLKFAHKHDIHIIVDELYLLSIFNEESSMNSVLSYTDIPDPEKFHFIWGFSKDFAVSGFRCGVLYTVNRDLQAVLHKTMYLQCVSTVTQHILMNLIKDLDWVDNVYIPTSHKRLRESHKLVIEFLQKADIPHLECRAGFFIWADFRKLLKSQSFKDEWDLFEYFMDNKLYISPGVAFSCSEPGWFRIIFAEDPKILQIAMERLLKVIHKRKEELSKMKI